MNAAMVHRGPDDEGTYVDRQSDVGLAARRLSIIDVEGGHQPLANEDGTVWAVLNGELYNFQSLRARMEEAGHLFSTRTDTEVLVHLYEDYGPELVHALEGMFAFAVWDVRGGTLLLARDRFGEKPLFYFHRGGELVFASELTALVQGLPGRPDLDPATVDTYFTHGYVAAPEAILAGVRQLPPAHRLLWRRGSGAHEPERYWAAPELPAAPAPLTREVIDEAHRLLDASVRSRLVADVPVGVFLSGGLDSTLVAALAAGHHRSRLKTFSVGYDVGAVSETKPARRAAEAIGTQHHELILTEDEVVARVDDVIGALDQPLADEAFVPLRFLSEFARREVTVIVGGEGADELFGGYPRYRWLARSERLPRLTPRRPLAAVVAATERLPHLERVTRFRQVLAEAPALERHVAWVTDGRQSMREVVYGPLLREHVARDAFVGQHATVAEMLAQPDIAARFMRLDQLHWLTGDVLPKADRASMQVSLELRTPYLSRELAELAATVPAPVHVRGEGKVILRAILRELLPEALAHKRRKVAFRAPSAAWLRGGLCPVLAGQLSTSRLYREGWFDGAVVGRLLSEHRTGRHDRSAVLWPLFVLGTWLDRRA